jgi:hypothetical protein
MFSTVVSSLLLLSFTADFSAGQQDEQLNMQELSMPGVDEPKLLMSIPAEKLSPAQKSPKHEWIFEYQSLGYGRPNPADAYKLRFRVFSQYRKLANDPAELGTRMLLRMWWMLRSRMNLDHGEDYNRFVDVYFSFGGVAGGEQLFDKEFRNGFAVRVNTVYIYDVPSFSQPIEMAREIAHEYGHAVLPPVGSFKKPEAWGNGDLGERVFLQWMLRDLKENKIESRDVMNALPKELEEYTKTKVDPLVMAVRDSGPDWKALKSMETMDAYLGVLLWAERLVNPELFSKILNSNATGDAVGAAKGLLDTIETQKSVTLQTKGREGTTVWIPVGKMKITGATLVKRANDWAAVKVNSPTVTLTR